jgi:DNA ligase-1
MRDFSQLLDALVYTRSRTAKLKLIGDYLKRTPDPDRGYALAALTASSACPQSRRRRSAPSSRSGPIPTSST